ncbi:MAG TPA: MarR family transcriptional regulator [Clostridiales bacterium]|nr:MarR family transcriptional regulator [Clostridiales bacterium]
MSQIKRIGGRILEKIITQSNIDAFNGAQGRILYVLWKTDCIPIIELSRKTGLAKTTLTSMLDRMETSGLITRLYDKSDRRRILVVLTQKANDLQAEYDKVSEKMNEIYYQGFSDGEIEQFEEYLNRILNNLEEEIK